MRRVERPSQKVSIGVTPETETFWGLLALLATWTFWVFLGARGPQSVVVGEVRKNETSWLSIAPIRQTERPGRGIRGEESQPALGSRCGRRGVEIGVRNRR